MIKLKKDISIFDIVSIILTVFVIGYSIHQDGKIKDLEYRNRAVDTKPILEIIGQPEIFVEKIILEGTDYIDYPIIDTVVIGVDIEVRQVIKLKNIGNEKAEIFARIFSDTLTGEDYIRNNLFNKKQILKKSSAQQISDFFLNQELLPGDTIVIEDRRKMGMDLITKEFVNHFLIIYDNSFGNRYDTYVKTKFKLNQPLFESVINQNTGELGVHIYKKTTWEFFKLDLPTNRTTKIYTNEEKKYTDNLLKKLKEKI